MDEQEDACWSTHPPADPAVEMETGEAGAEGGEDVVPAGGGVVEEKKFWSEFS